MPLQADQHMERYPENPGEVLYKNNLLEKIDLDRQWKFNFQLKERYSDLAFQRNTALWSV